MTQRLSKPAWSAVTAIRDITDPISSVVTGQEKLPIPIPSFIACAPHSAAAFSRHGVHEGQQFVLRSLWAEDGLTPGEVARRLGLATPTVTRATTRMEAAGLLRREPHPSDGRTTAGLRAELPDVLVTTAAYAPRHDC